MDKKGTYIIAGIIILAVIGFIIISFQKNTLDTKPPQDQSAASTTEWLNTPAQPVVNDKTVITAKHAYKKGEHIVAGEVPLPTSCDILTSNAIASADKKQVLIQLSSSVKTGEGCAQEITPARFKINAKADKNAVITATFNGQAVTLNLIEAGADENLDNFELYIKG
jgi:hypothetical protein